MKLLSLVLAPLLILDAQLLGQTDRVVGWNGDGSFHFDRLLLSVRLRDPFNRDFEIRVPVRLAKQFHKTATNGTVRNDISGMVRASISGKYALSLTVLEWQSVKSNVRDTTNFQLELDKPQTAGPIASFVYLRTVTVSRLNGRAENEVRSGSNFLASLRSRN